MRQILRLSALLILLTVPLAPAPLRAQTALIPRLYLPAVILGQPDVPLANGDFERGPVMWQPPNQVEAAIQTPTAPITARSGVYVAWLLATPDAANGAIDAVDVTIPRARPYLSFWAWVQSDEPTCGVDLAGVNVLVDDRTDALDQFDLCGPTQSDGWRQRVVDLHAYAGHTVTVELFVTTFNAAHASSMYIDDVVFQASP